MDALGTGPEQIDCTEWYQAMDQGATEDESIRAVSWNYHAAKERVWGVKPETVDELVSLAPNDHSVVEIWENFKRAI